MDNLKLQTVYVPVDSWKNHMFQISQWDGKDYVKPRGVERKDNRIVLTPQELLALIDEFDDSKYMSATNFLKSKGIEICDNTSLGHGIKKKRHL